MNEPNPGLANPGSRGRKVAAPKISSFFLTLAWVAATSAAEVPPIENSNPSPEIVRQPLAKDWYPPTAIASGQQGTVTLRLCHDLQGRVTLAELAQRSGFESLDRAAMLMGKQYRFRPNLINGQPQPACALIPVVFLLKDVEESASLAERPNDLRPPVTTPPPPAPPPPVRPMPTLPPPDRTPRLIPLISGTAEAGAMRNFEASSKLHAGHFECAGSSRTVRA